MVIHVPIFSYIIFTVRTTLLLRYYAFTKNAAFRVLYFSSSRSEPGGSMRFFCLVQGFLSPFLDVSSCLVGYFLYVAGLVDYVFPDVARFVLHPVESSLEFTVVVLVFLFIAVAIVLAAAALVPAVATILAAVAPALVLVLVNAEYHG